MTLAFEIIFFILLTIVSDVCSKSAAHSNKTQDDLGKRTADLKRQGVKIMELRGMNVSSNDNDTSSIKEEPVWGDIEMTEDVYENIKNSFDEEQKLLESKNEEERATAPDFKKIPYAKWSMPIVFTVQNIQSKDLQLKIRSALNDIQSKVGCIRFGEISQTVSGSHINFIVEDMGPNICGRSPLGRVAFGANLIRIAPNCQDQGTITHEVLHSLGFAHTQQRPDFDQYIKIEWNNMLPGEDVRSNFKPWQDALKNQGPFDYGSIMMYPPTAFTRNKLDTLIPLRDPVNNRKLMGRAQRLSNEDVNLLKRIYCNTKNDHCSNSDSSCDYWVTQGYCHESSVFYNFVVERCRKACNKC